MQEIIISIKSLLRINRSTRTGKVIQNILYSSVLKFISVLISLILVPLTISYLTQEEYGIWLTISSIVGWINVLDLGLTNGLRNKLSEAFALGDIDKAQIYVSTTFFLLSLIVAIILIVFFAVFPFLNWNSILNTGLLDSSKIALVVGITIFCFSIQFILRIVTAYYYATQKSAISDLLIVSGSALGLIVIFILVQLFTSGGLFEVSVAFTALPVLVFLLAFFYTFYYKNRSLMPRLASVDMKYSRDLIGLGFNFFIIQIAAVVLFATSNILITQLFGPAQVTTYNVAFKYFSIVTLVFSIFLTPMWNAFSDSYIRNDIRWIKKSLRHLYFLWVLSVFGVLIMVILSPIVYKIWVGEEVASTIPLDLSISCAAFVVITNLNSIPVFFINGVGKVKLQLYVSIVCLIIYFPLAFELSKIFHLKGIIIALSIIQFVAFLLFYYQSSRILKLNAKGILQK